MIELFAAIALGGQPYDQLPGEPMLLGEPSVQAHGEHVLFVNFDGASLVGGAFGDNAMADETQFPDLGGEWPPFGAEPGSAQREAILDAVRMDLGRFAIDVVDARPASGTTYTMLVVSPRNAGGSQLGVASVHCGASNVAGIGFAFHSASAGEAPVKVASTIAHEASHTWGIEHVDAPDDLMFPVYSTGDPSLTDGCVPLTPGQAYCGVVHEQHCPAGQQNAVAELEAVFGSGSIAPDVEAPRVTILTPGDDDVFAIEEEVEVEVEADDDVRIAQVKLYRDGDLVGTDIDAPYGWTLSEMEEGEHDVYAVAIDGEGNETTSEAVAFHVGEAPPEATDDEDDGAPDVDPAELDPVQRDAEGCGCRASSGRAAWWSLLVLPFAAVARRRPSRAIRSPRKP